MTGFVLVHGALHGAWCWEPIIEPLRNAGHDVEAVDLPGRDGSAVEDFDAYVDAVLPALERAGSPTILVGHSLGGLVASQVVERRPKSADRVILVNALLIEDGEAPFPKLQTAGEGCALLHPGALRLSPDGRTVEVASDVAPGAFYNRCKPAVASWAASRLCPESLGPLSTPLPIRPTGFGSVPKVYLGSRFDRILPWSFQRRMSEAAGAEFVVLDGDHSPMLSVPDELVGHLIDRGDGGRQLM